MKKFNIVILTAVLAVTVAVSLLIADRHKIIVFSPIQEQVVVQSGDTLSTILSARNISQKDIHAIDLLLKKECGVAALRPNKEVLIIQKNNDDSPVDKIILQSGPWKRVELNCINGQWVAESQDIQKDSWLVRKSGKIEKGGTFAAAAENAGIPKNIIYDVINYLAFEIDFERDIQPGQEFSVIYEENRNGRKIIDGGNILEIKFDTHLDRRGYIKMYRYQKADGKFGYYDEEGKGAIKSLKRTPIDGASISSKFGGRRHPVLGFTRQHKGVDFRAATGTKIPAAGAGKVVARGYNSGHGNFIKIRHANGFQTLYAHMSRFQKGVNVGTTVAQGQVIGYVGSTGLSTGPHLHYEIIKNGVHVNPMTVTFPRIDDLTAAQKTDFIKMRDKIDNLDKIFIENPGIAIPM